MMGRLKNAALMTLGIVFLLLAAAGTLIPVLPTTPFVLLAISCFSVNPKIQKRLMSVKFIREHAENYKNRTGLPRYNLIVSLSFLWVVLISSMLLSQKLWVSLLLPSVGIAVTAHLLCIANPKKHSGSEPSHPGNSKIPL